MCLSTFSGEAGKREKAYSPLTARELSSGEQAAHAEDPKAEEELKAKEDAEVGDEGSTPSATVDDKVVVCAVPSIDMTCAQCVENVAIMHPFLTQVYSPPPALGAPLGCSVLGRGAEPLVRTQFLEHPPTLNFGANHLKKWIQHPQKPPIPFLSPHNPHHGGGFWGGGQRVRAQLEQS